MDLFDFLNRQTINRAIVDLELAQDKKSAFLTVSGDEILRLWNHIEKNKQATFFAQLI